MSYMEQRRTEGLHVEPMVADVFPDDILLYLNAWGIDLKCDNPKHGGCLICYTCQDLIETWWNAIREAATSRTPFPYRTQVSDGDK